VVEYGCEHMKNRRESPLALFLFFKTPFFIAINSKTGWLEFKECTIFANIK
jgi:hypothetical protein